MPRSSLQGPYLKSWGWLSGTCCPSYSLYPRDSGYLVLAGHLPPNVTFPSRELNCYHHNPNDNDNSTRLFNHLHWSPHWEAWYISLSLKRLCRVCICLPVLMCACAYVCLPKYEPATSSTLPNISLASYTEPYGHHFHLHQCPAFWLCQPLPLDTAYHSAFTLL